MYAGNEEERNQRFLCLAGYTHHSRTGEMEKESLMEPSSGRSVTGLADVIKDKQWHKTKRMKSGLALNYLQGLCDHVDLSATLAGSFVNYPVPNKTSDGDNYFLLEVFQHNLYGVKQ